MVFLGLGTTSDTKRASARTVLFLASLLVLLLVSGCSHVSYLYQAGVGQLALYNRERPIDEVLADARTPVDVRERLGWVPGIKRDVEETLGMKATGNYTTYVDLKRPYVIWSITVSEPYELKLKTWSFPLVGEMPYLGFFKEGKARHWIEDYERDGLDTYIRGVTAYSTLGYLRDPLLSSMLYRRKQDVVNLIFHETTHTHLYIKGQGAFNEQAASYVGDYGERAWLIKTYGAESAEARAWKDERDDRRLFGAQLRAFGDELKAFYASAQSLSPEQRLLAKNERFAAFQKRLAGEQWKSRGWTVERLKAVARRINNNAALLAYLTYEDEQHIFDLLDEKCEGRVDRALRFLKRFAENWDELRKTSGQPVTPQSVLYDQLRSEAGSRLCLDADVKAPG